MRSLVVITAGLSTPSSTRQVADKIASSVEAAVTTRGEALETTVIELSELINDLAQVMSTGMATSRLDEVKQLLSGADGLVTVTPIFKASYSGLFKMFFDALDPDALTGMPTIIAATAGTARHSLVLDFAVRPLLVYMRADVVPTGLFAATEDFGGEEGVSFGERANRAARELADRMLGGVSVEGQPRRSAGVDPDEDFTPFSEMLKGLDGNG